MRDFLDAFLAQKTKELELRGTGLVGKLQQSKRLIKYTLKKIETIDKCHLKRGFSSCYSEDERYQLCVRDLCIA